MSYYKKLIGNRIYLSPINLEDAPLYTRWLNDLSVTRNLTLASQQITLHVEKSALEHLSKEHQYAVVTLEDDRLIGGCGFHHIDFLHQTAEIGIFIGEASYRGKGYGPEALDLLLGYGFDFLNLHSVMLRVFEFNQHASSCYRKLGFSEIGRMREALRLGGNRYDILMMDLLESEYRKRKQTEK